MKVNSNYQIMISWNEFTVEQVYSGTSWQWEEFTMERVWVGRVYIGTSLHILGRVYVGRVYIGTS